MMHYLEGKVRFFENQTLQSSVSQTMGRDPPVGRKKNLGGS